MLGLEQWQFTISKSVSFLIICMMAFTPQWFFILSVGIYLIISNAKSLFILVNSLSIFLKLLPLYLKHLFIRLLLFHLFALIYSVYSLWHCSRQLLQTLTLLFFDTGIGYLPYVLLTVIVEPFYECWCVFVIYGRLLAKVKCHFIINFFSSLFTLVLTCTVTISSFILRL